jgi:hypothetical protein
VGNIACYVKDFKEAINVGLNEEKPAFDMQEQGNYYEPRPEQGNYNMAPRSSASFRGSGPTYVNGANGNNPQGGWPSQERETNENQQVGGYQGDNQGDSRESEDRNSGYSLRHVATAGLAGVGAEFLGSKLLGGGNNNQNSGYRGEDRRSDWDSRTGEFRSKEIGGQGGFGGQNQDSWTNQAVAPTLPPYRFWTPKSSGSATCSTDRPTQRGLFPGPTPQASNSAWPSGHQPAKGECWPKDPTTKKYKSCWYKKVLDDTERGWPGKCSGLQEMSKHDRDGASCEESCIRDPRCPVWQEVWERGVADPVCFHGYGLDCTAIRSGLRPNVQRSQRLQHGSIRVLMRLKGMEIRNLKRVFDGNYYTRRPDAIENCKKICYSDILCQYWQYNGEEGCFVENPPMHTVAYPLTTNDVRTNSEFARTVLAGEYILHRCPKHLEDFTEADENAQFTLVPWEWNWFASHWPWDEGGWPWWGWLLFVLGCSCCCVCCMLFCGVVGLGKAVISGVSGSAKGPQGRTASRRSNSQDSSSSSSDTESTASTYYQKQKLLR